MSEAEKKMNVLRLERDVYHNCGYGTCAYYDARGKACRRPRGVRCAIGEDLHGGYYVLESQDEQNMLFGREKAIECVKRIFDSCRNMSGDCGMRFVSEMKGYKSVFDIPYVLHGLYRQNCLDVECLKPRDAERGKAISGNMMSIALAYCGYLDCMTGMMEDTSRRLFRYKAAMFYACFGDELWQEFTEREKDSIYKKLVVNIEHAMRTGGDRYGFENISVEMESRCRMVEAHLEDGHNVVKVNVSRDERNLFHHFLKCGCRVFSKKYFVSLVCAAADFFSEIRDSWKNNDGSYNDVWLDLHSNIDFLITKCPFIGGQDIKKPEVYYDRSIETGLPEDGWYELQCYSELKKDYVWDRI